MWIGCGGLGTSSPTSARSWRDIAVPDVLREGAATEIFERLDVRGSELVAVHPRPNENAWLLGYAYREKLELVGARGFEPPTSSSRTMRATKLRHAPTEGARMTGLRDDSARQAGPPFALRFDADAPT